ncbi:hypothetical protein SAMN05216167_1375 [Spirosoma endophyticum]|uniref:Uncharacterized protein n=1 Tax=Spirosoma endophyticum TaxID=662367 RepID=A0A1I2H0Q8_9BACT|nr:hypothetical protein SAMN05216167_1375 [Spirosoma endophyticum]
MAMVRGQLVNELPVLGLKFIQGNGLIVVCFGLKSQMSCPEMIRTFN